ncbi:response regulator transcription factor [Gordonia oryzae]
MARFADYRPSTAPGSHQRMRPLAPVRPPMRPAMPSAAPAPAPIRRPVLSPREVEVLLAWLESESKGEAAEQLFIAASTVSTHLARIRAKYAAVGRPAPTKTHLLARALQDGITRLEEW